MKPRIALRSLCSLAVALSLCSFAGFTVAHEERPNIIFILADDLGWGDLASYGHPYAKTPNIDRLAEEGTMFKRFYVTGRSCNPSRQGIMTSRSPASFDSLDGLDNRTTVTELLNGAGYRVGHFGKWHIGGTAQAGEYGIHEVVKKQSRGNEWGRDSTAFYRAQQFIRKNRDVPFYINLWTSVPHSPIAPSPNLLSAFGRLAIDESTFSGETQRDKFAQLRARGFDASVAMRNYLAEVWSLDHHVGRLIDTLEELALSDRTLVVFTSDHGPGGPIQERKERFKPNLMGYAGGLRGGKHGQFEGGIRTPFIIRWPGRVPAGVSNETSIISALDWLPTVCGAAVARCWGDRGTPDGRFEGEDIADIFLGSSRSRENPLFWSRRKNQPHAPIAVLQGNWKLHDGRSEERNGRYVLLDPLLYDLGTDLGESSDISANHPDVVSELQKIAKLWRHTLLAEQGIPLVGPAPIAQPQ